MAPNPKTTTSLGFNFLVISSARYGDFVLTICLAGIPYLVSIFFFSANVKGDLSPVTSLVAIKTLLAPNFLTSQS